MLDPHLRSLPAATRVGWPDRPSHGSAGARPNSLPAEPAATRERIRAVAEELSVLRGDAGFRYRDIAAALGTTRAHSPPHNGSKPRLKAELVDGFTADALRRIATCWESGDRSLSDRMQAQLDDLRRFYRRFNRSPGERNVWSPLARLRLDLPALGELAAHALERIDRAYDAQLREAVTAAIRTGELEPETPVADVACILRVTLLSCAPMTQDSGSFAEVERLFGALERLLLTAWGRGPAAR
jgi:AcrR family transcriptional regulator